MLTSHHSIEGSFVRWTEDLRKHLLDHFPDPKGRDPIPEDRMLPARWSLGPAVTKALQTRKESKTIPHKNGEALSSDTPTASHPPLDPLPLPQGWQAKLVEDTRMTPEDHWQDVRLISFDIPARDSGQRLQGNPGDCLTIYPKNFPEDVQKVITLMGWEGIADETLELSTCVVPETLYAPTPCTLRGLLLHNIDINSVPRRSFLKSLSYFSDNQDHKDRLLEFTMTEYLDEYFDYATRSRRTIIEVLEEFDSIRVPAERLLDVFPLIRGRDFSIANGGKNLEAQPSSPTDSTTGHTRIELLVAFVKYRTILRKPRQGLCSRYLASLPIGTTLNVTLKPVLSPVHGEANAQRPLIAMATGTGIAPVRSLIQERLTHPSAAPILLFFGNRNRSADYFFDDEWQRIAKSLAPSSDASPLLVFPAFSRDQREKIYVQDLVRKEAPRLAGLIAREPIFAICGGSSKMADACKHAVFDPFKKGGNEEERQKMLDAVTWWQEIW